MLNLKLKSQENFCVTGIPRFPATKEAEGKEITGEITPTTIACAVDASIGTPKVKIPKPLMIGGIVVVSLIIAGISYRIIRKKKK